MKTESVRKIRVQASGDECNGPPQMRVWAVGEYVRERNAYDGYRTYDFVLALSEARRQLDRPPSRTLRERVRLAGFG